MTDTSPDSDSSNDSCIVDFKSFLEMNEVEYTTSGCYYIAGKPSKRTQGWILHISVIRSQVRRLLIEIIPILKHRACTFKIVQNEEVARITLDGEMGIANIGKILTVYPCSDEITAELAKELAQVTSKYRGPSILTDAHIGGTLYTRYGAINPIVHINALGEAINYMYSPDGSLVADEKPIPFTKPNNVPFPFENIDLTTPTDDRKHLNSVYRTISTLKFDPKGNVVKAIYLNKFFIPKRCVVKEGKSNMWSDKYSRDMIDRLKWQYSLHLSLGKDAPLPRVIDFISEKGASYLVMEYIKGQSINSLINKVNSQSHPWSYLNEKAKNTTIELVLKVIDVINYIHSKGIIHRDITPVNFLVSKRNRVTLIDTELSYNTKIRYPMPPFEKGTPGYLSPEQDQVHLPTKEQDIYSLGATIVNMLTGLSPLSFVSSNNDKLYDKLMFFINDSKVASVLACSLSSDAQKRPSLISLKSEFDQLKKKNKISLGFSTSASEKNAVLDILLKGIKGLVKRPTIIKNELWRYRIEASSRGANNASVEFGRSAFVHNGLAGTLYFLSHAKMMGIDVSPCEKAIENASEYLLEEIVPVLSSLPPGLYCGTAGLAISLNDCINSSLVSKKSISAKTVELCFRNESAGSNLGIGAAGQAQALLKCKEKVDPKLFNTYFETHLNVISSTFDKKLDWIQISNEGKELSPYDDFINGNCGIYWFLLNSQLNNYLPENRIAVDLQNISKRAISAIQISKKKKNSDGRHFSLLSNIISYLHLMIKAYEVTKESEFQNICDQLLNCIPTYFVSDDIYQLNGLTRLGEIYLDGLRVFGHRVWKERADWVAGCLLNTCICSGDDYCYWYGNNSKHVTSDLLTGTSGILYYLLRYVNHDKINYCLLG